MTIKGTAILKDKKTDHLQPPNQVWELLVYTAFKLRCFMVNYALIIVLRSEAQCKSCVVIEGQGH